MDSLKLDVVIPAAGVGSRMGAKVPKQYLMLGTKTILERTLEIFLNSPLINHVIVVISKEDEIFQTLEIDSPKLLIAYGGKDRADSVRSGLNQVTTKWVLVHDAARPLLTLEDLAILVVRGKESNCGAILASPVADTLKKSDGNGKIARTVIRKNVYRALTPQFFKTDLLIKALDEAAKEHAEITDESSALEFLGYHPLLVEGRSDNIKITNKADLRMAKALVKLRERSNKFKAV